ncbi:MAG TPA: Rap1a/Tai family immunity protein, partial [Neisseria sp.]|nr:Rap1a/Tai family immunity protein [Neisseria sp.]
SPHLEFGRRDGCFANGYINAVNTVEARAGRWCGMTAIKPHEVVSQVRDFIMASGADTKNQAADIAVAQALQRLHPCAQTAQKGKRK